MAAPLIYINAYPGVGKLTLARQLQHHLPNSHILDNHTLIDPVEAEYPRTSAQYSVQRTAYRRARLAEVARDTQTTYFFTDAQTEFNECVADYYQLSQPSEECPEGRRFYSVVLECEIEENVRRLLSPGRGEVGKGKLRDEAVLRDLSETMGQIWRFGGDNEIVVDATEKSAEEVADIVLTFVKQRHSIVAQSNTSAKKQ